MRTRELAALRRASGLQACLDFLFPMVQPADIGRSFGQVVGLSMPDHAFLVWPLSCGLIGCGGWLLWRQLRGNLELGRLLLGRAWRPDGRLPPALLLLPETRMVTLLLTPASIAWFGPGGLALIIALLAASLLRVRRAPARAVTTAAVALGVLGLAVSYVARMWFGSGIWVAYGFVIISSHHPPALRLRAGSAVCAGRGAIGGAECAAASAATAGGAG